MCACALRLLQWMDAKKGHRQQGRTFKRRGAQPEHSTLVHNRGPATAQYWDGVQPRGRWPAEGQMGS